MRRVKNNKRSSARNVIYPAEWVRYEPYESVDAVDRYFASLASRVYRILYESDLIGILTEDHEIKTCARCLTGWFEDIVSEVGIWSVFNSVCKERYGRPVPFYPLDDYVEGAVNWQDILLIIWDHCMTKKFQHGKITNPENPYLRTLAETVFEVFDAEYETAPSNDRLHDFIHSGEDGYWLFRSRMEWLYEDSYLFFRGVNDILEEVDALEANGDLDEMALIALSNQAGTAYQFLSRHNLLSIGTLEMLSRLRNDLSLLEIRYEKTRFFEMTGETDTTLEALDAVDGNRVVVPKYCFKDVSAPIVRTIIRDKMGVMTPVLHYRDDLLFCSTLIMYPAGPSFRNAAREQAEEIEKRKLKTPEGERVAKAFLKEAKGERLLFVRDRKELEDLQRTLVGPKVSFPPIPSIPAESVCIFLFLREDRSILVGSCYGQCIKSPFNPYYDPDFAEKNALAFYFSNDVSERELSQYLHLKGYLPDAGLNSLQGKTHGQELLHDNGAFLIDYFLMPDVEG